MTSVLFSLWIKRISTLLACDGHISKPAGLRHQADISALMQPLHFTQGDASFEQGTRLEYGHSAEMNWATGWSYSDTCTQQVCTILEVKLIALLRGVAWWRGMCVSGGSSWASQQKARSFSSSCPLSLWSRSRLPFPLLSSANQHFLLQLGTERGQEKGHSSESYFKEL